MKEGGYHLFVPSLKTNVDVILEWKMCSFSQSICKDLDSSRTHVTTDKNLLISPILASDDTFYPRLTISGGGFSGVNLNLNEIRIMGTELTIILQVNRYEFDGQLACYSNTF